MDCFQCSVEFHKNSDLLKHIRVCHSNVKTYKCSEVSCLRVFHQFNSYSKHRRCKHPDIISNSTSSVTVEHAYSVELDNDIQTDDRFEHNEFHDESHSNESLNNSDDYADFLRQPSIVNRESNFKTLIKKDAEKFLSYCYSRPDITRKRTLELIDYFTKFQNGLAYFDLKQRVIERLTALGESFEKVEEFKNDFESLQHPFDNFDTDYFITKHFVNQGTLILPTQVKVGERDDYRKNKDGNTIIERIPVKIELIPLRLVLKKFFELPNVLYKTMNYIETLKKDKNTISNFIQGEFWKHKMKDQCGDKVIFPLCIATSTKVMIRLADMQGFRKSELYTLIFLFYL